MRYCKTCGSELTSANAYCPKCAWDYINNAPRFFRRKHLPQYMSGVPSGTTTVLYNTGKVLLRNMIYSGEFYIDTWHSSPTLVYKAYPGVGSAYSAGISTAIDSCDSVKVVQMFHPSVHIMADNYSTITKQIQSGRLIPTALYSGTP